MTLAPPRWLPPEAAIGEPVRTKVREAVDRWSEHWFSKSSVRLSDLEPITAARAARTDPDDWRGGRGAISVKRAGMAWRLLNLALDVRLELLRLTERDRKLLDAFERTVVEDLVLKVEQALGAMPVPAEADSHPGNPYGRLGGVMASLTDDAGMALLSLAIPLETLLPLCVPIAPGRLTRDEQLGSLTGALATTAITVEANLGEATVRLEDLRALAPGDVLILDRAIDEGLEITLAGSRHVLARAKLTDADGRLALRLHA